MLKVIILKQKLTSRKFWVAIGTILSGLVMMFGYSEEVGGMVAGAIVTIGGSIGYMVAEGIVDAARIKEVFNTAVDVVDELVGDDIDSERKTDD